MPQESRFDSDKPAIALLTGPHGEFALDQIVRDLQAEGYATVLGSTVRFSKSQTELAEFLGKHRPMGLIWNLTQPFTTSLEFARLTREQHRQFPLVQVTYDLEDFRQMTGVQNGVIGIRNNPDASRQILGGLLIKALA